MSDALKITPSIKEIFARIGKVINDPDSRRRVLIRAVLELKDLAAGYPQAGPWNSDPGTRGDHRWYQRGFGTRYKRKDGTTGGKNTSQKLQKSWQVEVQRLNEFSASAFTEVTYAPLLFDPNQKVHWAEGHGWQDLDQIEKDYAPRFEKMVLEEIDNQIEKI